MARISQASLEETTGLRILLLMERTRKGESVGRNGVDRIITDGDGLIEEVGWQRFGEHAVHHVRVEPHERQPAFSAGRMPKQRPEE